MWTAAADEQAERERELAALAPVAALPPDAGPRAAQLLERWNAAQAELAHRRSNLGARRAQVARAEAQMAARRRQGDPADLEARFGRIVAACAAAGAPDPARWLARLHGHRARAVRRAALAAPLIGLAGVAAAGAAGAGRERPGLLAGLLALAGALGLAGAACAAVRRRVRRLDAQLAEARACAREWQQLLSAVDAAGPDEFRAALCDWHARLEDLRRDAAELAALEQEVGRLQHQAQAAARSLDELLRPVAPLLARHGGGTGPESRVRALAALLDRWRQVKAAHGQARRRDGASG